MQVSDNIREGFYAQRQLYSKSSLIAWSHRGRFAAGLELAREAGGAKVLDYGCGDGTFLALLAEQPDAPADAVGVEIQAHVVDDCRRRFTGHRTMRFGLVDDLRQPHEAGSYDAIYCMEVLEHVVDTEPLLAEFDRLLAPGGALVISVPIEIGLPVVVKQLVRRVAGWRGVGHYPGTTGYTPFELLRSVLAGPAQHVTRPIHRRVDGSEFCDHKGFNWRRLRAALQTRFDLVRESTSPIPSLGPQCGSQRWFVARKRSPR
jgi:SAM-dependent methyltransferase